MAYLAANQGPDEFSLVQKEVVRVRNGPTNTITKGDLVPFLPYAPDQDLAAGGWRFATGVAAAKGGERLWGVALEDAGNNQYARCQISGVCKVNGVGKLSDTTTQSSGAGGLSQGVALTCDTASNLTSSSKAYEAVTDDVIICVVLFGEASGPGRNEEGLVTVLLTGPTFAQRSL